MIGIVLINSGTAERPDEDAVRAYLASMLSDPMLISCPPVIWKRVLKYAILPERPKQTVHEYERMWDEHGSIFMRISHAQRDAVERELRERGFADGAFAVQLAMRYSSPSIASAVEQLKALACDTLVAVPLYPQYVSVCAGTCLKAFAECVQAASDESWQPRVVEVPSFYEQEAYQQALAASVQRAWTYAPGSKLCVSLHSTLVADIEAGDPYDEQNRATARDLAARLGVPDEDWQLAYQSKFDSRKWLGPLTENVLEQWAGGGVTDVCIVCPGFVAENIETKVEVDEQLRGLYLDAAPAGSTYTYVPTLDDDPGLISAIASAIQQAL